MEDVLDEFIGEEVEMEGLAQDLIKFLEAVLNPKGGGRGITRRSSFWETEVHPIEERASSARH